MCAPTTALPSSALGSVGTRAARERRSDERRQETGFSHPLPPTSHPRLITPDPRAARESRAGERRKETKSPSTVTPPTQEQMDRRRERAKAKTAARRLANPQLDPGNDGRMILRTKAEWLSPSEPWTTHMAVALDECGVDPKVPAREVERRLKELGVFPPAAEHTPMRPCPTERRRKPETPDKLYPPQYVRIEAFNPAAKSRRYRIQCEDCHAYDDWQRMQWLKKQGLTAEPLPPERKGKYTIPSPAKAENEGSSQFSALRVEAHTNFVAPPVSVDPVPLGVKDQLLQLGLSEIQAELLLLIARGYRQSEAAETLGQPSWWGCTELSKILTIISRAGYVLTGNQLVPRSNGERVRARCVDPSWLDRQPAQN